MFIFNSQSALQRFLNAVFDWSKWMEKQIPGRWLVLLHYRPKLLSVRAWGMYCWDIKSYLCIIMQNLQIYPKTTKNTHLNTQTCTPCRHVFIISVFFRVRTRTVLRWKKSGQDCESGLEIFSNFHRLPFLLKPVHIQNHEVYFNTDRSMTFKRPKGIEKPSRVVFVEIWRIAVHTNSYGAIALEQSLVGLKSRSSIFPCILACRLVSYGFDFDYWITKWQKEEIEEKCFP